MADINYIFLSSLSLIILGFIVKKLNIITEEGGKSIAKLIINVTLPALILRVASTLDIQATLLLIPFICILFSFLVLGIVLLVFRRIQRDQKGLCVITAIGFNMGLFAFPLIESAWGVEGLQYIAMMDIGNAFMIFVVSYTIANVLSPKNQTDGQTTTVSSKKIIKGILKSAPLMCYILALSVNISGMEFPAIMMDILDILSRANTALTLILLGIYINFRFDKSQWSLVLKVLIIRYSIGLTIGILLFLWLPFPLLFRAVIMVGLILPLSMTAVPYAVELGYQEKIAGMVTNFSIIISFALMWMIVLFIGPI